MVVQKILDQPWIALAFVVILALLWLAAWGRCRRERLLRLQAKEKKRGNLRLVHDADEKPEINSEQFDMTKSEQSRHGHRRLKKRG
jgi:flagellar biosynthesis/type III secretory pathway M-ring protein FliF/YscJ